MILQVDDGLLKLGIVSVILLGELLIVPSLTITDPALILQEDTVMVVIVPVEVSVFYIIVMVRFVIKKVIMN